MTLKAERRDALEHRVEGLGRLLGQPEFAVGERARQLVQAVEEQSLLERIVAVGRESDRDSTRVYFVSENQDETLHSFGVIACPTGVSTAWGSV